MEQIVAGQRGDQRGSRVNNVIYGVSSQFSKRPLSTNNQAGDSTQVGYSNIRIGALAPRRSFPPGTITLNTRPKDSKGQFSFGDMCPNAAERGKERCDQANYQPVVCLPKFQTKQNTKLLNQTIVFLSQTRRSPGHCRNPLMPEHGFGSMSVS